MEGSAVMLILGSCTKKVTLQSMRTTPAGRERYGPSTWASRCKIQLLAPSQGPMSKHCFTGAELKVPEEKLARRYIAIAVCI